MILRIYLKFVQSGDDIFLGDCDEVYNNDTSQVVWNSDDKNALLGTFMTGLLIESLCLCVKYFFLGCTDQVYNDDTSQDVLFEKMRF